MERSELKHLDDFYWRLVWIMFVGEQHGKAEKAMNFYASLFKNSSIIDIERYGQGEEELEGTLKRAAFKGIIEVSNEGGK